MSLTTANINAINQFMANAARIDRTEAELFDDVNTLYLALTGALRHRFTGLGEQTRAALNHLRDASLAHAECRSEDVSFHLNKIAKLFDVELVPPAADAQTIDKALYDQHIAALQEHLAAHVTQHRTLVGQYKALEAANYALTLALEDVANRANAARPHFYRNTPAAVDSPLPRL